MKFRDYVDKKEYKKFKKIRNVKKTSENKVEKNKKVNKKIYETSYIEFGISKKYLKDVFDYIRSWFIRYKIDFKSFNPYLTIFELNYKDIDRLFNNIEKIENNVLYEYIGSIKVIKDENIEKILIEYKNNDHSKMIEEELNKNKVNIISKECYVKLFEVRKNSVSNKMYEDIFYSCPNIPNLKINNIRLRRD